MASSYLELINGVLRDLNEVELTTNTFSASRGVQTAVKDYVNRAIDDIINVEYGNLNNPTGTVKFKPNPGKLIIFRSYLNHCVEQKNTDGHRISIAYNYNKE